MRILSLFCCFVVFAAGLAVQAGEASKTAKITTTPDGLAVTVTDIHGDKQSQSGLDVWESWATKIFVRADAGGGFTVDEFVEGPSTITVITSDDNTLIYERDALDPAPTIEIPPSSRGESTLIVTPAGQTGNARCTYCASYENTTVNYVANTCTIPMDNMLCTECTILPCPPPSSGGGWDLDIECGFSGIPPVPWCQFYFDLSGIGDGDGD